MQKTFFLRFLAALWLGIGCNSEPKSAPSQLVAAQQLGIIKDFFPKGFFGHKKIVFTSEKGDSAVLSLQYMEQAGGKVVAGSKQEEGNFNFVLTNIQRPDFQMTIIGGYDSAETENALKLGLAVLLKVGESNVLMGNLGFDDDGVIKANTVDYLPAININGTSHPDCYRMKGATDTPEWKSIIYLNHENGIPAFVDPAGTSYTFDRFVD